MALANPKPQRVAQLPLDGHLTGAIPPTIVLCGGAGTRLNSHARGIPKHLITVQEETILEHAIKPFRFSEKLILATSWQGDQIKWFLGEMAYNGSPIMYSHQPVQEGVIAAILQAVQDAKIDSTFIITHGDEIIPELDVARMLEQHRSLGSLLTVALSTQEPHLNDYIAWIDDTHHVTKMSKSAAYPLKEANIFCIAGTYICEPEILIMMDARSGVDNMETFLHKSIARQVLFGFPTESKFYNLNTAADIAAFEMDLNLAPKIPSS